MQCNDFLISIGMMLLVIAQLTFATLWLRELRVNIRQRRRIWRAYWYGWLKAEGVNMILAKRLLDIQERDGVRVISPIDDHPF